MTTAKSAEIGVTYRSDRPHPESNITFAKSFLEHHQSNLLTNSIRERLQQLYPNGKYCIGQNNTICWGTIGNTKIGYAAPSWFYIPNVSPLFHNQIRRHYMLWLESIAPLIVLEFVCGDGSEERDRTPMPRSNEDSEKKIGKFWMYEQAIRVPFYGIYEVEKASIEVYHWLAGTYEQLSANERGHYPIRSMGVELGIWQGRYENMELPWLRWWDSQGNLLLTGDERADRLAEKLRQFGVNPDEV